MDVRHRLHGKMHKLVDIALLQEQLCGRCQKVSEAEVFARGGIKEILDLIRFGIGGGSIPIS
jgi:3-hydroxy-D-aspartate aldolase